jgi:N-alpha-acetyltransferase 15/16, NatA auxiliary subunit
VSLKALYDNAEKRQTIQDLAEGYLESLRANRTLPSSTDSHTNAHPKSKRDLNKSFRYIDEAIEHTPTLVELYLTKARLFKYKGDQLSAVETIMMARDLDMQDRFVNTKVGKYLLRHNRNDEALNVLKDFTRVSIRWRGRLIVA